MKVVQDLISVNFAPKKSRDIKGVVLHSMAGTQAGSIAWFKNPTSEASAHYCISKDGEIVQTCYDKDISWHAGIFDEPLPQPWLYPNPNHTTIGIELEDCRDKNWQYPETQRQALRDLLTFLSNKWSFPLDRSCIFAHKDLNPSRRSDPVGAFSWDWVFQEEGEDPVKIEELEQQISILKNEVGDKQKAIDAYEIQIGDKNTLIANLEQKCKQADEFEQKWDTCTLALKNLEDKLLVKQTLIATMTLDARRASQRINDLEGTVDALKTQIQGLQGQVDSYTHETTWRKVWKFVLDKLSGILGR